MMFNRIREAWVFTTASRLARKGDPMAAKSALDKLKGQRSNRALTDALRAQVQLSLGDASAALESIRSCKNCNKKDGKNSDYLSSYCDYLEAVISNDLAVFNALSRKLAEMPDCYAKQMLVVVKPVP